MLLDLLFQTNVNGVRYERIIDGLRVKRTKTITTGGYTNCLRIITKTNKNETVRT